MWLFWLMCVLLIVIVMALLLRPLFKSYSDSELADRENRANQRKALNIELYEQKKAQIEQDFANGLLDEEARIQAQNEIEHSLILDAESSDIKELTQLSNGSAKILAFAFVIIIPVLAVMTYISVMPENFKQIVLSEPPAEQAPMSGNKSGTNKQVPDIATMVASLEKKLQAEPDNLQGWNMLGRSYMVLKRYTEAVAAYEKALALVKQNGNQEILPELELNYVEALMQTKTTGALQKARRILAGMLAADPNNTDALWFMGFLDYEAGKKEQLIKRWTQLLSLLPENGKQAKIVTAYLNQIRAEMKGNNSSSTSETPNQTVTKSQTKAETPAAPSPGQQLTNSAQEQAFIASMVARVEQRVKDNPQDVKSWKTLGKSYGVLNRQLDSANAYAKAVALDSSDASLLIAYSNAVVKTAQAEPLDKARQFFAQLVEQNAQNLDALFLSGSLARVAGDLEQAKLYWNKLLPQLPPQSKAYENVKTNLDSL